MLWRIFSRHDPQRSILARARAFTVKGRVRKDGHEAHAVYSRRGAEVTFSKLGVFTRATFTDARPPLTPGVPESRQYQLQYVDGDEPVGEMSSTYSVLLSGAVAA